MPPFLVVTQSVCCALLSLASSCRYYSSGRTDRLDCYSAHKILRRITIRQSQSLQAVCTIRVTRSQFQLLSCQIAAISESGAFLARWSSTIARPSYDEEFSLRPPSVISDPPVVLVPLAPERLDSAGFAGLAFQAAAGHFADRYFQDCFDHAWKEGFQGCCKQDRLDCSRRSFPFGRARFLGCALSFEAAKRPDPPALLSAPSSWHVLSVPSPAPSPYRTQDLAGSQIAILLAQAAWLLSETSHHSSGVRRRCIRQILIRDDLTVIACFLCHPAFQFHH